MKSYLTLILGAVLMATLSTITPAHAQVEPFNVATLTLSGTTVAASTTSAVTTSALDVRGSEGIGFVAKFKLSGTGVAAVSFNFDVSADGTTWTTTQPFTSGTIAATGTTSVVTYFNFSPDDPTELRNIRYIRLATVQNANTPSTLTIQSLQSTKYNR
ncbi:hypothetical protein BH09VER1_BH09VER1_28450 [soil metagenome]